MLATLMLGCCGIAAATTGMPPPRGETPRATDLLRAERLADDVRRRLELPPARAEVGWRAGGEGWRRRPAPAAPFVQDGDVIINVKPPRRPDGGGTTTR
jgi:hypothetical protein